MLFLNTECENSLIDIIYTSPTFLLKLEDTMKVNKLVLLLIVGILVSGSLIAKNKNWNNSTELSFVNTSGNTEVTTLSAKNKLTYKFSQKFETVLKLAALYGESNGVKNSENYSAKLKGSYLISKRFYASLVSGWSKDIFAGIDSKMWAGPALGYKILTGPTHTLDFEAGLEYVDEEFTDETKNDYFNGRAFTEYKYSLTEKSNFGQSLEFNYDFGNSDNYDATSVTSVTTALSDVLSLKASYKIAM